MKFFKIAILCLPIAFFSCNEKSKTKIIVSEPAENKTDSRNDALELENLIKKLYKWIETKSSQEDFEPLLVKNTDSLYIGLDLKRHQKRLKEFENTHFFSEEFILNYDKIAVTINEKMKDKSLVYYVGELPPYGNDANPWCDCQDNPDKYWEKIKIQNLIIKDKKATFNWTWGDGFKYKVKAVKENNVWKISYLQGFNIQEFISK